jgi:hypothetical protein
VGIPDSRPTGQKNAGTARFQMSNQRLQMILLLLY